MGEMYRVRVTIAIDTEIEGDSIQDAEMNMDEYLDLLDMDKFGGWVAKKMKNKHSGIRIDAVRKQA